MTVQTGYVHLLIIGVFVVAAWLLATYLSPRLMLLPYKRAILNQGIDNGPIPVNTLYVQPQELFVNPFTALPPGSSKLLSYGTNRDTLYVFGWLDLSKGPQVLSVPDMGDRYYSVQLTDPSKNTNFAYVGTRTTSASAGAYLLTGPGWEGQVPSGMTQISSPNNALLIAGRVFVEDNSDVPEAYRLAQQVQLRPLDH
jgi:hypothetical protein